MRGQPDYDSVELTLHDLEQGREDTSLEKRMKSHDEKLNLNNPEPSQ